MQDFSGHDFDAENRTFKLRGGRILTGTEEKAEEEAKKNESSPGLTSGRASVEKLQHRGAEPPASKASEFTDENDHRLIQWQRQVLDDDTLARTPKWILLAWGIFSELDHELIEKEGAWARVVAPIPSEFIELTRLSSSSYYKHAKAAEASRWVEPCGALRYEAGNRMVTQVRYRLVLEEESNG